MVTLKGRGTTTRPPGRFEVKTVERVDDGWASDPEPARVPTTVQPEHAKSILTRNDSPDIGFDRSINPYRGCEHGCVYCYARPSHSFVGLSPGLDFETRLFYKAGAARLLEAELARPGYVPKTIMLGANTDPYQPIEKDCRVTRDVLEVLARTRHPVGIVTKGTLIERDLPLLADLARDGLVHVMISLPTLDADLKRTLEPRAASPAARLATIRCLAGAGVPVGVLCAPVIPALTDHELEGVLAAASAAGARTAGYVVLRLPYEVSGLFQDWLATHRPDRAAHVMSRVHSIRGGRDNDPCFGTRMKGQGADAALLRQRFDLACRRLGLEPRMTASLNAGVFRPPVQGSSQLALPL
jgi:DNA repair photolyase